MTAELQEPGTGGAGLPSEWSDLGDGAVVALTTDPAKTPFAVMAIPGQTADVWDVLDENGDRLVFLSTAGPKSLDFEFGPDHAAFEQFATAAGGTRRTEGAWYVDNDDSTKFAQAAFRAAVDDDGSNAVASVDCQITGFIGFAAMEVNEHPDVGASFKARAHLGQIGPLIELRDEDGNVVSRTMPSGVISTSAGEPADDDINPGECFRYFIPTNGAAKTGFKGKTLDGTVVKREDAIP